MDNKLYDVAIVGGGIAGFEAALTLKTFKREFLWLGSKKFGDKLALAESVNNFLSFSGSGSELRALLEQQSQREEIPFTPARVDGIYAMGEKFLLTCGKETFAARSVILATGVETKGRLKGEQEFLGRGVSYCAVCDGALYRGKKIAAVLSRAEFAAEAEYLASMAREVIAFCLYPDPKFEAQNISICPDRPLSIEGRERVEGIRTERGDVAVDAVFFLKNAAPPAALVGGLETQDGHVKVLRDLSTNLSGLFAAGDVTGRPYQYIKAAGEGLCAAFSANEYLLSKEKKEKE